MAKQNILVGDDDEGIRSGFHYAFEDILTEKEKEIYNIEIQHTAQEVLRKIQEGNLAFLISDGEMDSSELTGDKLTIYAVENKIVAPDRAIIYTSRPELYSGVIKYGIKILEKSTKNTPVNVADYALGILRGHKDDSGHDLTKEIF